MIEEFFENCSFMNGAVVNAELPVSMFFIKTTRLLCTLSRQIFTKGTAELKSAFGSIRSKQMQAIICCLQAWRTDGWSVTSLRRT